MLLRVWHVKPCPDSAAVTPPTLRRCLLLLDGQWLTPNVEAALKTATRSDAVVATLGFVQTDRSLLAPWRLHDYTPAGPQLAAPDASTAPTNGGADELLQLVKARVLPLLTERHAVNPQGCSLFGHSMAGLFGLHVWLQEPGLFENILAISPSLWWRWPWMLDQLDRLPGQQAGRRAGLHMMVGEHERRRASPARAGQPREAGYSTIPLAREFLAKLQALGVSDARLDIIEAQTHGPMLFWAARHCLQRFVTARADDFK